MSQRCSIQQLALSQVIQSKDRVLDRERQRRQALDRQSEFTATYIDTDATSGLTRVRRIDGGEVIGKMITNAGLTEGDQVIVQRTWGNPYASIKAMPR